MGGERDIARIKTEERSESIPLQPINQALAAEELDSNHDKGFLGKSCMHACMDA